MTFPGFRCDYCDRAKGEVNHWFLLWVGVSHHQPADAFHLIPWDDAKAQTKDHEHICGQECAGKALAKWMAATPQREAQ